MKHWFKDQHFRSLLKNSSYLGVSQGRGGDVRRRDSRLRRAAASACVLFGTLILITSYVKAVSGIAKFQSWQLIVRYGGHGVAHGDPEHFKVATGFAFALDMVSGIAGMLVGAALLPFIGALGRDQSRISVAGNALLHAAADHGLGDARRRAARARPVRPDQLVRHADADLPRDLGRHRVRRRRSFPVYVAIWYRHRP